MSLVTALLNKFLEPKEIESFRASSFFFLPEKLSFTVYISTLFNLYFLSVVLKYCLGMIYNWQRLSSDLLLLPYAERGCTFQSSCRGLYLCIFHRLVGLFPKKILTGYLSANDLLDCNLLKVKGSGYMSIWEWRILKLI